MNRYRTGIYPDPSPVLQATGGPPSCNNNKQTCPSAATLTYLRLPCTRSLTTVSTRNDSYPGRLGRPDHKAPGATRILLARSPTDAPRLRATVHQLPRHAVRLPSHPPDQSVGAGPRVLSVGCGNGNLVSTVRMRQRSGLLSHHQLDSSGTPGRPAILPYPRSLPPSEQSTLSPRLPPHLLPFHLLFGR